MLHPVDAAMREHAAQQHSTFARRQALAAGASPEFINGRVQSGDWIRESLQALSFPGHDPACVRRRIWLALHQAGPDAVASHWAAMALHQVEGFPLARVAVTVPHGQGNHRNPFGKVHQTVAPASPVLIDGIPTTPLARTLVDMGKVLGKKRLGEAVDDAVAARRLTIPALSAVYLPLARSGREGVRTMAAVLATRDEEGYVPPHTVLERLLDDVLDTLPGPRALRQYDIGGRHGLPHRVDRIFLMPPLIVEGDGRRWHMRVRDQKRDRERDRHALRLGYPTARYGWEELMYEREAVRAELLALLERG
ncbi:MAG TPA: hypothetical protein VHN98_08045 [Acidimicrobiales bacterium]|nr:hypothetical protein [Acidimicrobiales bacterium]